MRYDYKSLVGADVVFTTKVPLYDTAEFDNMGCCVCDKSMCYCLFICYHCYMLCMSILLQYLLQKCQYTSMTNVCVTWYVWVLHVTTWAWLVVLWCLWQKCALTYGQKIEQWHEVTQLLWVIRRTKTNIFGTLHKSRLWKTMLVRVAYCPNLVKDLVTLEKLEKSKP